MAKEKPDKDDKEQSQRFVETAKELEADKSGRSFHKAVRSIAPNDSTSKAQDKSEP